MAGQLDPVVDGVADNDHDLLAAQVGDRLVVGVDCDLLAGEDGRDVLPADNGHHVLLPDDDEDAAHLCVVPQAAGLLAASVDCVAGDRHHSLPAAEDAVLHVALVDLLAAVHKVDGAAVLPVADGESTDLTGSKTSGFHTQLTPLYQCLH